MKKKIFLFILILIIILLCGLTVYKFLIAKEKKVEEFKNITLELKKEDLVTDKKDKDLYSANIINDIVKRKNYELVIKDKGINGDIYIDVDSNLYINDNNSNIYKISSLSFKALYKIDEFNGLLNLYALSNDGKLYNIFLNSLDIKSTVITEIAKSFKITNFTNIKINDPYSYFNTNIVVLSENGNMYEPRTGLRYTNKLITFMGQYYVFEDNTIANSSGKLLKNGDNYYKIKYYLSFMENNSPFKDVNSIVLTEDNKIIYCIENSDVLKVYNKTIKNIEYKIDEKEYKTVKLKITFTDNSIMNLDSIYTEYYGFE